MPIDPPRRWDGISESQKRQLAKRVSPKRSKQENWYFIYETLFPGSTRPESPFIDDTHLSEELLALREFAVREAPGRVAQFTNSELPPDLRPNQEHIEAFTQAAIRDVFDMLLERWETSRLPSQGGSVNDPTPNQERGQDAASSSEDQTSFASQSATVASSETRASTSPPQHVFQTPSSEQTTMEPTHNISHDLNTEVISQTEVTADVSAVVGPVWNFEEPFDPGFFDFDNFSAIPEVEALET